MGRWQEIQRKISESFDRARQEALRPVVSEESQRKRSAEYADLLIRLRRELTIQKHVHKGIGFSWVQMSCYA
jgi:hypothetical protein